MEHQKVYQLWLEKADDEAKQELLSIANDEKEIEERFYKSLEFGTGGLRGIIGYGTNRINVYTVRQATQGLANYIMGKGKSEMDKGVVISYDSRRFSDVFAREAACVLCANGIRAYLFKELRPVPELSFSVRELGTAAGIMVTASHNPAKYNGYKVYSETGEQISLEMAEVIIENIAKTDLFDDVKTMDFEQAKSEGLLTMVLEELDDRFLEEVKKQSLNPEAIAQLGDGFKVVYTPFHGSGNRPVRRVLSEIGIKNVFVVKEQELPDPAFSTVKSPNPEDSEGFYLAIPLAESKGADLIIGTDPDCDRMGVFIRDREGKYQIINGNQIGILLLYYILENRKEKGILPANGAVIKTIVSTFMADAIAESYGMTVFNTLTGFKFIGEKIREFESTGKYQYVFGFEESYGYLAGTHSRDKDGVVASMLMCEATAYFKTKGKNMLEVLDELYTKYGAHYELNEAIVMEGKEGLDKIVSIMAGLRENPPTEIAGYRVIGQYDYLTGEKKENGTITPTGLPKSNVLQFKLEDGSYVTARPSGTEPKIKFYYLIKDETMDQAKAKAKQMRDAAMEFAGIQ